MLKSKVNVNYSFKKDTGKYIKEYVTQYPFDLLQIYEGKNKTLH